jgi:hypothetical protein
MSDLIFGLAIAGFFVLMVLLAAGCARLQRRR